MKKVRGKEYKVLLELGLIEPISKSQYDDKSDNQLEVTIYKYDGQEVLYYQFVENFERELDLRTKLHGYKYQKTTTIATTIVAIISVISIIGALIAWIII